MDAELSPKWMKNGCKLLQIVVLDGLKTKSEMVSVNGFENKQELTIINGVEFSPKVLLRLKISLYVGYK